MEDKINRLGKCPNCGQDWDGGDMYLHIASMAINTGKKEGELKAMAGSYGWTEFNQTHFSNLISHELPDGRNLLECPNMRCMHVFDRYTGEEYSNLRKAFANEPSFYNTERTESTSITTLDISTPIEEETERKIGIDFSKLLKKDYE